MALIKGSVKNLWGGISQQADLLRMPNQVSDMCNLYPSLVDGVVKRPPLEYFTTLEGAYAYDNITPHVMSRDEQYRYLMYYTSTSQNLGALRLSDGTLAYRTILGGLTAPGFTSIADWTFVYDKTDITRLGDTTINSLGGTVVYVRQAAYDTIYKVTVTARIDGILETFVLQCKTPSNASTGTPPSISVDKIMRMLMHGNLEKTTDEATYQLKGLGENGEWILPSQGTIMSCAQNAVSNDRSHLFRGYFNYTVVQDTNMSRITVVNTNNTTEVSIVASDSLNLDAVLSIQGTAERVSDLPKRCFTDYIVKITGADSNSLNDYFLIFKTAGRSIGAPIDGAWVETVDPLASKGPNAGMPYGMVHTAGTFSIRTSFWLARRAGDEDTNPDPLFIDKTISSIFLYRNRLGILSADTLTLSEAGDFFNFYAPTVLTTTDADPIHLSAGSESISHLKHAIPYQENLMLFADNAQFNLTSGEILSPETADLRLSTAYSMDTGVKPQSTGDTVLFATYKEGKGGLTEVYTDNELLTRVTASITDHVPTLIKGRIKHFAVSTNESLAAVNCGDNELFMYKYYWSGNEKLQSAWFRYELPWNVSAMIFFESILYLFIAMDGKMHVYTMNCSDATRDVYLDGMEDVILTQQSGRILSFTAKNKDVRCVLVDPDTLKIFEPSLLGDGTWSVEGSLEVDKVYKLGIPYDSYIDLSEQFIRDPNTNQIHTHQGRLQLRRAELLCGRTATCEVVCGDYKYLLGPHLGTEVVLDSKNLPNNVSYYFPIKEDSKRAKIRLQNNTPFPSSFLGLEWEANATTRIKG
jgi:hypothetical protein